ncbi:MAG TPA: thioredoxin-dependent thiol peroxidase [Candidatus Saccharimonadales bacterium]|nr:thioredoxin-dependent thiol peroxidase [Candidatus Saccharimonadales bacterium]
MQAHGFSLPDQYGDTHKLSDYLGKWVVVYFYPKDDTPGCTKEACSFRDNIQTLASKNVVVIGISKDSVGSHQKFGDKYKLNFTLLSDESGDVVKKYDAWGEKKFLGKSFMGILRKTYIIDPKGKIAKVYEKVNPDKHTAEILEDLQELQLKN